MPEIEPTKVASWNSNVAHTYLEESRTDKMADLKLMRAIEDHAKAEPTAATEVNYVSFLMHAYKTFIDQDRAEQAYEIGVLCHKIGNSALAQPMVAESGLLFGLKDLEKAEQALESGDFRRAADKGFWATARLGDAIRFGNKEAMPLFYAAAHAAFEGNASYGAPTNSAEKPIIADCTDLGIEPPLEDLKEIRRRHYDNPLNSNFRIQSRFRHATVLAEFGIDDGSLAAEAAKAGIQGYLDEEETDIWLSDYLEHLSRLPEEAVTTHMLRVAVCHKTIRDIRADAGATMIDFERAEYAARQLVALNQPDSLDLHYEILCEQISILSRRYYEEFRQIHGMYWGQMLEDGLLTAPQFNELRKNLVIRLIDLLDEATTIDEDERWYHEETETLIRLNLRKFGVT